MPRPIIIDTDPGIDDAVAILLALAAAELEVRGLVAVAGNLPLAATFGNARAIVELAGRPEIPVHAGCPRPMSPAASTAEDAHGNGGLGELTLPPPAMPPRPEHGVVWLIGFVPQLSGFALKLTTQRGYLQGYAATMLLGIAVILLIVLL